MVLENATASDAFTATDTSPSSDFDPYDSTDQTPSTYTSDDGNILRVQQNDLNGKPLAEPVKIKLNDLPRRWAFFGQAQHPDFLLKGVQDQVTFVANLMQRPVTQDEANALAFHFAKSIRMASYGAPIGIAVAQFLAYRGNSTYRFPLWTPIKEGGRFQKDVFGPLRGMSARVMWQASRLSAYTFVGTVLGQIFFGSYALSVSLAGRAMDPRLKDFNEALRNRQKSGLGTERGQRVEDQSAGPKGNETYDMARQRRSVQEVGRRGKAVPAGDDASPTGGAFSDDFNDADEVGFMDEQEVRRKTDALIAASRNRSSPTASGDTTSNVNSQTPRASREAQPQPPSTGSSWDRLRQGAMSGQPGDASKGMAPSGSAGSRAPAQASDTDAMSDSFSFSSDRESAKSEAQREFDARMERERAGKDFNEGGKRW
ncbi:hypothetical protein LTR56_019933 [Elasticomyces elasticus]|nr:hypothetical protein LTR56_019933 [Elasticomyces elasticus]KAK3643380.1 hypothetical protein LTR22_015683 [Elasticomyces elasticus]KAK4914008.1 hypothetical protein LTR49_017722 [Elasticomyces elasticus]KAK5755481.1 hypothetical protein LTS12_014466 [Elasticomyces elasticus]